MKGKAMPEVPANWNEDTSFEHWIPDASIRRELLLLNKSTIKKTPRENKATWAKMAKLLSPDLAKIIGRTPWRIGQIPSPRVAEAAMALLRFAVVAERPEQVARVMSTLSRILPELPGLCLPEVVGYDEFVAVISAITARRRDATAPLHKALTTLLDYATDS